MKVTVTILFVLLQAGSLFAQSTEKIELDAQELIGVWMVDLRPTPDADPYFQEMEIKSIKGDLIDGTFYQSPIEESHINTAWGAVRFAFRTKFGDTEYHSMGTLKDGKMEGMTHAIGRGFLSYWTAERKSITLD